MTDPPTAADIAGMIDHALLKPTLTDREMDAGCRTAIEYGVASVCILPYYLGRCVELLADSDVAPSTVIGFPHGGQAMTVKFAEVERAISDGGEELDMVANISKALSGDWDYVEEEIRRIVEMSHAMDRRVKVIFENCYLEDEHKLRLCRICGEAGADWVKTSTGFGSGGAEDHDLRLMREHSPDHVQVKASGGIRTLDRALAVRALGCTRIGASATAAIVDEARQRFGA